MGESNGSASDALATAVRFAPEGALGEASQLRILYAGVPELDRGRAFLAFLRANFTTVDALPLRELDPAAAEPYDVIVADWQRRWGPAGMDPDHSWPDIHLHFTKPIVLVAAGGRSIQSHRKMSLP